MPVSKRVRYEVLRRDNHSCKYCGAAAPDVALTVDHVVPVALGGGDDPSNLVAACSDCNSGKTSTSPDGPLVSDVKQDAMRWAAAIRQAAEERQASQRGRTAVEDWFLKIWKSWTYGGPNGDKYTVAIPDNFGQSIHQILAAGLEPHDLEELVGVAMRCKTTKDEWKYFCGCCWRRVREAQERAQEILAARQPVEPGVIVQRLEVADYDAPDIWLVIAHQWRLSGRGELRTCGCDDVEYCGYRSCMLMAAVLAARELALALYSGSEPDVS
ncbi:HNH endonuclease [Nocardia sp. NPDC057440]|uniref:HNH endonuclease n=1 Tax=Nocardia sp. NPDC057440 TaxID=3346134 RepID=UPI00367238C5